jgi:hypothetical protein
MANRPIFIASKKENILVEEQIIDFTWVKGMATSQKQKSITNLHQSSKKIGIEKMLEISTKSMDPFGKRLSAFNLLLKIESDLILSVESAFQGSKVFQHGGPYKDLYFKKGYEIKKDPRLINSGELILFNFFGDKWELEPKTAFYDWLYLNALIQNVELNKYLLKFDAFSDIEFNPNKKNKPVNCQARSAALFVSMHRKGLIDSLTINYHSENKILKDRFLDLIINFSLNLEKKNISKNKQLEFF